MSRLWLVALQEYKRNVFKKSFLLALFSVPLMIGLGVGMGIIIESSERNDAPVGYVDQSGVLASSIPAPRRGMREPVEMVPFDTEEQARASLQAGDIQAYYVLPSEYPTITDIQLFFLEEPGKNATRQFYDFLQINLLSEHPGEIAHRASEGSDLIIRSVDGRREMPGGEPPFGVFVPLILSFSIAFLLMMNSGYLMQAVADEKENRTIEVVMTSLSPFQLIGGKVIGIFLISATQLLTWIAVGVLVVAIARAAGLEWVQDLGIQWEAVASVIAVAIPTYILVAALTTAIGATVTQVQEGQSIVGISSILLMLPLYVAQPMIETPNGSIPMVLSFLPFTSMMAAGLRNMAIAVPLWQIVLSVAIQSACAAGALWLAAGAFRLGMLRYGQRLRLREVIKGLLNNQASAKTGAERA
jgi:ABC-2 type transport system permease protein